MSVIIVAIYKFYLLIHMEAITMNINQLKFVPTLQHQSNVLIGHCGVCHADLLIFERKYIFNQCVENLFKLNKGQWRTFPNQSKMYLSFVTTTNTGHIWAKTFNKIMLQIITCLSWSYC